MSHFGCDGRIIKTGITVNLRSAKKQPKRLAGETITLHNNNSLNCLIKSIPDLDFICYFSLYTLVPQSRIIIVRH